MRDIIKRIEVEKKQLHFAFLFASPLVLSSTNKFILMEPLNYMKEFSKIKDSVAQAQV